jgi:hypothetical protein
MGGAAADQRCAAKSTAALNAPRNTNILLRYMSPEVADSVAKVVLQKVSKILKAAGAVFV